jgi:hypothetical protein
MMALGAGLLGAGIKGGDRRAMAVGGTWAGLLLLASLAPIFNVPLGLAVPLVTVMLGLGYWKSERGRPVLRLRQRQRRPRPGRSL